MNLGARRRKKDARDLPLGRIQAPVAIPPVYKTDLLQYLKYYQGQQPACGAHAYAQVQNILRTAELGNHVQTSPRFFWNELKLGKFKDGYRLEDGTDMTSIFKVGQNIGICDFSFTGNDVELSLQDYANLGVTQNMLDDAQKKIIGSYAFSWDFSLKNLQQLIYQNKAVILLMRVDEGFFNTQNPTFTTKKWGHFVCAVNYDENGIWIIDSTEQNTNLSIKYINKRYFSFIEEAGTVVDVPETVIQNMVTQISLLQQLINLWTQVKEKTKTWITR